MKSILLKLFIVVFVSFYSLMVQAGVTGRNVTKVVFASGGEPTGAFKQEGVGQWTEYTNRSGVFFSFRETGRDDWSVYLHDDSRDVYIQLDLHRKKVGYRQGNGQQSDIYDIVKSESAEFDSSSNRANVQSPPPTAPPQRVAPAPAQQTNGYNSIEVLYNAGSGPAGVFRLTSPKQWTENSKFSFQERNRDEWSIYLHDASRDVNIQLDLHRKKVIYSQGQGPRSDLYDIVSYR